MQSYVVDLLLLTNDFDTYWDYIVCRYSNDQISWWAGSINYCLCAVLL